MYQISNRQYNEVLEILTAFASQNSRDGDLRTQNRYRRTRLLIRALAKRKPIDNESSNIINIQKNK